MLRLSNPVEIAPNLSAGVRVGDSWVTVDYSPKPGSGGRTRYVVSIFGGGIDTEDHSMQSGCGGGSILGGLRSALSFLGAAAEAVAYSRGGRKSDNLDLYAPEVMEWADAHASELEMLALEVDESDDCVVEV